MKSNSFTDKELINDVETDPLATDRERELAKRLDAAVEEATLSGDYYVPPNNTRYVGDARK